MLGSADGVTSRSRAVLCRVRVALRNRLKGNGIYDVSGAFETRLTTQLERQYQEAVQTADYKNKSLEAQAETMRMAGISLETA